MGKKARIHAVEARCQVLEAELRAAVAEKEAREAELSALAAQYNVVHELFARIVENERTITIDATNDLPEGKLHWEGVQTEAGSTEITIWFEPAKTTEPQEAGT